jgi:predicted phosphodiesterase
MIGIISDVHGNHVALMAVLAELDALGVREILCLGDIAGYYSQINECCDTLRERNVFSLTGNHDGYLVAGGGCLRSDSATRCLMYQHKIITPSNLAWLATLPYRARKHNVDLVHGGWNDPLEEYLKPSQTYFDALAGQYFASGHTHVQYLWSGNDKVYCNPGSVGQPRDGDPRAAYAIWDGQTFALRRVEYDVAETQRLMRDAGFAPYFYDNLSTGSRIGGKIDRFD